MRTLLGTILGATIILGSNLAQAQIDAPSNQSWLHSSMTNAITDRHATPIMRILTKQYGVFKQTNKPDYKNNDVPYEFTVRASDLPGLKLEGVMLCPVSGHVPLGGSAQVNRANADKYAQGNVSEVKHNGRVVASAPHNGAYVTAVPFCVQLQQGRNELVMFQHNPKTREAAYVGGFPMGRQFNITVTPNSSLRRAVGPRAFARPWAR